MNSFAQTKMMMLLSMWFQKIFENPNAFYNEHREYYENHNGHCVIPEDVIQSLHNRWDDVRIVSKMIPPLIQEIPPTMQASVKANLLSHIKQNHPSWILPQNTFPQQLKTILYTDQPVIAEQEVNNFIHSFAALPLNCLKEVTGMTISQLRKKYNCGAINATDDKGILRISIYELQRVEHIAKQYIVIDDIVQDCLSHRNSKFRYQIQYDRDNLIFFCEENSWWGIHHIACETLPIDGKKFDFAIFKEDADSLTEHIQMWIWGYQQPAKVMFGIITDMLSKKYPVTAKKLLEFEKKHQPADAALVDMAQLLYISLSSELHKMKPKEIENIIVSRFSAESTISACEILCKFLQFGKYTNQTFSPNRLV